MDEERSFIRAILCTLIAGFNGVCVLGMYWETPYREIAIWAVGIGMAVLLVIAIWEVIADFVFDWIIDPICWVGEKIGEMIYWIKDWLTWLYKYSGYRR